MRRWLGNRTWRILLGYERRLAVYDWVGRTAGPERCYTTADAVQLMPEHVDLAGHVLMVLF